MREQREQVTLNRKEQKRLKLLNDLEARTTTVQPVLAGQARENIGTPGFVAAPCVPSAGPLPA